MHFFFALLASFAVSFFLPCLGKLRVSVIFLCLHFSKEFYDARGLKMTSRKTNCASILIISLLLPLCTGALLAAEQKIKIEARTPWSALGKRNCWTPVMITVENEGPDISGVLQIVTQDAAGSPVSYARRINLAQGTKKRLFFYLSPDCFKHTFEISLVSRKGRPVASEQGMMRVVESGEVLVGMVQHRLGPRGAAGLNLLVSSQRQAGARATSISLGTAFVDDLPDCWYGYEGLDLLVWIKPDFSSLSSRQRAALKKWVFSGGRLLLSVGPHWQEVKDSFLDDLLPVTILDSTEERDFSELVSFAGAGRGRGLVVERALPIPRAVLGRGRVLASAGENPLLVIGRAGMGRCIYLAADLSEATFSQWPLLKDFWEQIFKALEINLAEEQRSASGRRYQQWNISASILDAAGGIFSAPAISLRGVTILIIVYLLVIGPGDYFLLKKLKRLHWTWVTFFVYAVVFAVAVFGAAYLVRGGKMRMRLVTLVDIDGAKKAASGHTFFGIFSPKTSAYKIGLSEPDAAFAPGRLSEYFHQPPRPQPLLMSEHSVFVQDEGIYLERLPIRIWSARAFAGRWVEESLGIEAEISKTSFGLSGSITNNLSTDLANARLIYGEEVFHLGSLRKGEKILLPEAITKRESITSWLGAIFRQAPQPEYYYHPPETEELAPVVRRDLAHLSFFKTASTKLAEEEAYYTSEMEIMPGRLSYLDLSEALAAGRAVLVAEAQDAPLTVNVKGWDYDLEYYGMVRVIFPVE
jgi:hypothetical protein